MEAGNGLCQGLYHPQLPARNVASTMIKVEQRDQRATTPSGSHRVLLKLKKISANRPKSMHEADLDEENNVEAQQQVRFYNQVVLAVISDNCEIFVKIYAFLSKNISFGNCETIKFLEK